MVSGVRIPKISNVPLKFLNGKHIAAKPCQRSIADRIQDRVSHLVRLIADVNDCMSDGTGSSTDHRGPAARQ